MRRDIIGLNMQSVGFFRLNLRTPNTSVVSLKPATQMLPSSIGGFDITQSVRAGLKVLSLAVVGTEHSIALEVAFERQLTTVSSQELCGSG